MKQNVWKLAVIAALIAAIAAVVAARNRTGEKPTAAVRTQTKLPEEPGPKGSGPREPQAKEAPRPEAPMNPKPKMEAAAPAEKPEASRQPSKPKAVAEEKPRTESPAAGGAGRPAPPKAAARTLPRLVDLGADRCIPCRMMAPILRELAAEYQGKLQVEFIDVWENREAGERFGIRAIPTQIFYDESGKEFFRHEGFFSKEDILAKFREHGVILDKE